MKKLIFLSIVVLWFAGCMKTETWTLYFDNDGSHSANTIGVYAQIALSEARPTFTAYNDTWLYGTVPPGGMNCAVTITFDQNTGCIFNVDVIPSTSSTYLANFTATQDGELFHIP